MYHNNEISIINLSRLQCIVSVSVSANNFSTNTGIGNIGKKWYRSISGLYTGKLQTIITLMRLQIGTIYFGRAHLHFSDLNIVTR